MNRTESERLRRATERLVDGQREALEVLRALFIANDGGRGSHNARTSRERLCGLPRRVLRR